MVPTLSLRIQSMLRSMMDVVIPALPQGERLALDQAQIIAGCLRIMAEQCSRTFHYEMTELRENAALLRALVHAAKGGPQVEMQAVAVARMLEQAAPLEQPDLPQEAEVAALVKRLKGAVAAMVDAAHADGAPGFYTKTQSLVMEQSAKQITRERRWVAKAGFEADPASLPSLDDILSAEPRAVSIPAPMLRPKT